MLSIDTLKKIYDLAREVPKVFEFKNKYTWSAINHLVDCKYMDINDVLSKKVPIVDEFIRANNEVLIFPNIVNGTIVDLYVRGMTNKDEVLKLGSGQFPYNIGNLSKDFKYGDPLFLVEGIGDLAGLKIINPDINVVAMQSNSLSKAHADIISKVTNNIVIFVDNDDAGKRSANYLKYAFKKSFVTTNIVNQFSNLKDTGEILDMLVPYLMKGDEELLSKINNASKYYETKIDLILKKV